MALDLTPPRLVSLSFPEVIDLGDGQIPASFSVTATDNLGMDQAVIWFDSPIGYGFSETMAPGNWSLLVVGGNWINDQASVTRYFAPDHSANAPRTVSIDRVVLEDLSGNSVTYSAGDLAEMGLQTSFELIGGEPDLTPPRLVSLSFPEVIDLGDGQIPASFSVTATDNLGMDQAVIWFDSPIGYGFSETMAPGNWSLLVVGGNWINDQASVTRYFAPDHSANAPRTVSIDRVVLEDLSGNSVTYSAGDLAEMGLQTSFEIWQGGPPTPDLSFAASRRGDTLVVRIVNEGEERDGVSLSGQISFALDGASYVSASATGTSAFNSNVSQAGGSLQLNFNASLAGARPPGSTLVEFTFDLTHSGSVAITGRSIAIDGRNANLASFEPVSFEILPPLIARDDSSQATQDGPEVTGNVLANDGGSGLAVTAVAGSAANVGNQVAGAFGTLTLTADGSFTYVADNAARLPEGETEQDIFSYRVADSSGERATARLSISVTGVNDPASIAGDTTELVVEDDATRAQVSGVLTVTDPDAGEDRFADVAPSVLAGDYGAFTFNSLTGEWSYTLDNASEAVQSLPEGTEVTDSLTVTSLDGTASETITVTVLGVNDPGTIAGISQGSVRAYLSDQISASGVLQVQDIDTGEDRFQPVVSEALQGTFGSFTFDPETGEWSYEVDPESEAVAGLAEGEEAFETLVVTSLDGTASETIAVSVIGLPDPMVSLVGLVTDPRGVALENVAITFTTEDGEVMSGITDAAGTFMFDIMAGMGGSVEAALNYAGAPRITAADALEVLRMAVGLAPSFGEATPDAFIAADLNRDGQVTAADALDVLRAAVGLESDNAPKWVFVDAMVDLSETVTGRSAVNYETGIQIAGFESDLSGLDMRGILLGDMSVFV